MKLTKTAVDKLQLPASGYVIHWDDELPGFGCRVTATGAKSYVLQRRINNRSHRLTICRAEEKAPEWARNHARTLIGDIIQGGDPVARKRRERLEGVTLQTALVDYTSTRDLKPRTVADMGIVMRRGLGPWMSKPITAITADMVERRHRELGTKSRAQADLCMRYLRAVFSFSTAKYLDADGKPVITGNPVAKLSTTGAWFSVGRRRTVLKVAQLPAWYSAVLILPVNVRDYLMFLLLSGLRGGEAAMLKWNSVDLAGGTFTIEDTKNRQPHQLPTSDYLQTMLERRHAAKGNDFVFPGLHGKGHIKSAESAMRLVTKVSGVEFCRHDLRRTFATTAESLDLPAYAVKRLLNHASTDVTAGYLVIDVERLRRPMQRITDFLLAACGERRGADVVPLDAAR